MSASPASGVETRALAFELLRDVIEKGRALDDAFDGAVTRHTLEARDRAFVRRLATHALRHFGQSEAIIAALLDKKKLRPRDKALRVLFAMAACELVYLKAPAHAAINAAVEIARSRKELAHQTGLINAVLRRLAREGAGEMPALLNVPDWLRKRWEKTYGAAATAALAEAHLAEPPLDLTANGDPAALAARVNGTVLPTGTVRCTLGGRIEELPGFAEGAFWVQDAAAALPPHLLGVRPGESVLDACAAPGGKTAFLAAQGAEVTALDKEPARLERVRENLARLKREATLVAADLTEWAPPQAFDKILLDAPCSATGTLRRHPDVPWLKGEADIAKLAALQSALLDAAARMLKPGGTLVYAVCSLEHEEGEDQAARFLAENKDFSLVPVAPGELAGCAAFVTPAGHLRTTPADWPERGGLDGFFAARFRRT